MIGVYDYTVVLTYLSLLSAAAGILVSLSGTGHPYIGAFFLLFSGLCDAFDGKVARMKKDRTKSEKEFGIQIDSLADQVAFGVLPAAICSAVIRNSSWKDDVLAGCSSKFAQYLFIGVLYLPAVLFVLAAMIRLAYYNVTEQERQETEDGAREYYTGVPVTTASLLFPLILLIQYLTGKDMTLLYAVMMVVLGFLFLSKMQVKKPGTKGVMVMVIIGAIEGILIILWKFM